MELNQLRGFLMVARTGSFTRAAEALYLTQPALSLQVKALETAVGELLFERRGGGLLLTPAGRILLRRAEQMMGLLEQAEEEIAALRGVERGRLSIGTNDSYALYLLPDVVRLYRERFPGVELRLTNSCSTQVASMVADGEVDFGLVTLPLEQEPVQARPLLWREDVLACAPGHALCSQPDLGLEQLAAYPLLLLDRGSSRSLLDRLFEDAGLTPRVVIELASVEVIKRYVEIDLGISIIPRFAAEREIASGSLHVTRLRWLPPRAIGLIQRRTGYLSPAAEKFVELLQEYAATHWADRLVSAATGDGSVPDIGS